MKKPDLKDPFVLVEHYLSGERTDPTLCTTREIAKQIEKKYKIKLKEKGVKKESIGLYKFEIQ